jgi:uncharacterized protein YhaN
LSPENTLERVNELRTELAEARRACSLFFDQAVQHFEKTLSATVSTSASLKSHKNQFSVSVEAAKGRLADLNERVDQMLAANATRAQQRIELYHEPTSLVVVVDELGKVTEGYRLLGPEKSIGA